jgi:hypothetical protein
MMTLRESQQARRFHGLDFLKLCFVITIVIFHVWENVMYQDVMELPLSRSFYTYYGKVLSVLFHYAGPFLAGLSFFLFGYRHSRFSLKKWVVFILGVLLIQYTAEDFQNIGSLQSWSWDVYSYLFVAFLILSLIPKSFFSQLAMTVIGLLALLPSPQFYSHHLSSVLIGVPSVFILNPSSYPSNGWFIFPWIFLPLALYGLGFLARRYESKLERLRASEVGLFGAVILILSFFVKPVPFLAGPRFYEFLFWQPAAYFWLHFLCFLFFIRIQFSKNVSSFFDVWIFRQISKLQWVQHLWLCYFLHFVVLQILLSRVTGLKTSPFALDMLWISVFLGTEVCVRLITMIARLAGRSRGHDE